MWGEGAGRAAVLPHSTPHGAHSGLHQRHFRGTALALAAADVTPQAADYMQPGRASPCTCWRRSCQAALASKTAVHSCRTAGDCGRCLPRQHAALCTLIRSHAALSRGNLCSASLPQPRLSSTKGWPPPVQVRRLAALLSILKLPVHALHAGMQQRQRLTSLDRFRANPEGVLVATDVAARGLDIPVRGIPVHCFLSL